MSNLKTLMDQHCPNGVEYKKLKDISIMQRGTSITKKDIEPGTIPVISGGKVPSCYCNKGNRDADIITVAGSGVNAGYVQYWQEPIFVNDAFSVKAKETALTKYLFYCLSNLQESIYNTRKGAGIPHVHIADIENFEIPVPPAPVQEEIIRILDKLTELQVELQAELQAEMAAREKEYLYYRNKLLDVPRISFLQ